MKKWESFQFANRLKFANHWLQIFLILSLIIGCNYLALNTFMRFDLTENHHYALSPESRAYLDDLEEPVRIIVTIPGNSPRYEEQVLFRYVRELLNEYSYASKRNGDFLVTPEYVDIYQDLAQADSLSRNYGLEQVNSILVVSGNRRKLIRGSEILSFEDKKPVAFNGEAVLTSAIMEVTQETAPVLYFLSGHREALPEDPSPTRGLSKLARELQMRNYSLQLLDLTSVKRVPEDCAILLIADPMGPLLPSEVDLIRNYLFEDAGSVILWTRPGRNIGLDSLLDEWGLALPDHQVVEPDPAYLDASGTLLVRNFGEHPITQSLINNQTFVVSSIARPVFPIPPKPPDERLHYVPLFASSNSSWSESTYQAPGDPVLDPGSDVRGPVPIAASVERRASSQLGIRVPGGRIIIFGSPDLFSNQRVASLGNVNLFFNTINWLMNSERMLVIPPRDIGTYTVSISQNDLFRVAFFFLAIPASIALLGAIVFWIRQS